jgi:hypothetical protein
VYSSTTNNIVYYACYKEAIRSTIRAVRWVHHSPIQKIARREVTQTMSAQELLEQLWNAAQQGDVAKAGTCLQVLMTQATRRRGGLLLYSVGTAGNLPYEPGTCDLTCFLFAALQVAAVNDWPDTVEFLADSLWAEIQRGQKHVGFEWAGLVCDVIMATTCAGSERGINTLLQSDSFEHIRAVDDSFNMCNGRQIRGRAGHTWLTAAAARGHAGVARAILQYERTNLLEKTDLHDWIPLEIAAREGHVDVARTLLEAKAQLCRRGGKSALVAALEGGFVNVVQLLVDAKTNVNRGPLHPLELAHQQGRDDVVQLLLDAKADVNFVTEPASDDDEDADQSDAAW